MKRLKYDFGENCFDLLRLFSAFQVMTQHIMRHIGGVDRLPDPFLWFNGVVILFCISGFLIPASMERSSGTWEFVKKRVFRVMPSLWICIAVGVVVAGLFCGFVFDKTFAVWFAGQLSTVQGLPQPDFISSFGTGTFNGSLWTIIYTIQFYLIIALVYRFLKNRKLFSWIMVLLFTMALNMAVPPLQAYFEATGNQVAKNIISHTCMTHLYIFFIGCFIYRYREKIVPVLAKTKLLCLLLLIARSLYCSKYGVRVGEYADMISVVLLCMLTVGIGYGFGKLRFKFDLSYGLYLYHMIVVGVFVQLGLKGEVWQIVSVYAISLLCAFASYFLIDRPIGKLSHKNKPKIKTPPPRIEEGSDF